ncbi:LysR family transcriptional regulator [Thalassospira sp. TSL5-1]|uniref:LysR family transcriptional regulator n=1 Tax=Thalassospira sp. TSL5-1 TaxID=1544451 RepID=UPI0009389A01|nr:LysR family transcriptional regulator [Thalassospira sp. TSL5-1]OKH86878.1 LysR family transcriptional regulator [Thalassospira sp. TSL5-1]
MKNVDVDLNLLVALDVLLVEGSVTAAAQRLGLSISAMSRTLARLRAATGDPLLVRAGRGMVPTPRAEELRDHVHNLARDVQAVLQPQPKTLDVGALERTFTIRVSEAFMACLAGPVVAAVSTAAPGICLRFAPKPDKNAGPLRDGMIDLEIGVIGTTAPEIRTRLLFCDHLIGIARAKHPLLSGDTPVSPDTFAACHHIAVSKDGNVAQPVDAVLNGLGLARNIRVIVPGFPDAIRIARHSELVALVPHSCLGSLLQADDREISGLMMFDVPVLLPEIRISAMWHPRQEADPAHKWLRDTVIGVCRAAYPPRQP